MSSPQDGRADRASLLRRWPTLLALIAMWIALWSDLSVANVLGGAAVAVAVLGFAGRIEPRPFEHLDALAALRYLRTFAVQLVVANWQVVKAVLRPETIRPGIIAMPLHHASDAVVTLVANSITLTPGTLTLETERRGDVAVLYIHALDLADAEGVREAVCELEVLAVEAFADREAQAVQARTLAELERAGKSSGDGRARRATRGVERGTTDGTPGDRAPDEQPGADGAGPGRAGGPEAR